MDLYRCLGPCMFEAMRSPLEVSLQHLLELAGALDDPLGQLPRIDAFLSENGLVIDPPITTGGLTTSRLLRARSRLSTEQRVAQLARDGEGAAIEFKSSLLTSMKDWKTRGELVEHGGLVGEALKTICAFLNTDGGSLVVGVDDDGHPVEGLDLDMRLRGWNRDKLHLWWSNMVRDRFYEGRRLMHLVRSDMVAMSGLPVLLVEVAPRTEPAFVKRQNAYEYFVRTGPQTEGLDLPGFYAHWEARVREDRSHVRQA